MRVTLPLAGSFLVLLACGGPAKPAATEVDTSSLDSTSGSSGASAPTPASATAPAADATPAAAPAASGGAAAPAAVFHPTPSSTGDIDGKPFAPKLAQIVGPVQKDGRVVIVIHEGTDCLEGDAKSADGSMMLTVPWKDGYKTDLASLKRAKGNKLGEAAFVRKQQVSATFKPSGLVTIVSAPTAKDAIGKMKIDLVSGGYILAGDLDVKVCAAP